MSNVTAIGTAGQVRATRALAKFCRDHNHTAFFVGKLEECLAALESKDSAKVIEIMALLERGGMGSYLDWYPEVISEIEDPEYVETVWCHTLMCCGSHLLLFNSRTIQQRVCPNPWQS